MELQDSSINYKSKQFQQTSETSSSSVKYFREVDTNNYASFISYWSHLGMTVNKIQKMYNGNRRVVGYKFAVWNCGRGLVQDVFSTQLEEVKQFIAKNKPHCFGIIESDFFSTLSQNRSKKYSTSEIKEKLKIEGYTIEFPETWEKHGQARLILLKFKLRMEFQENKTTNLLVKSQKPFIKH